MALEHGLSVRTKKTLAVLGFLFATIVWGSTFVVVKTSVDGLSPFYLLAYRFTIASVGLAVIFFKKVRTITKAEFQCGCFLGILLLISYCFQTYGIKYTTASKNAFITTLYVVIVPFLHLLFNKVKPTVNNIVAAAIALIGLALISLKGDLTVNLGDFLTFICGVALAFHIVMLSRYTAIYDPVKLTVIQMVACAAVSWVLAALFEGPCDPGVFKNPGLLSAILFLGLIASMCCFLFQTVGQAYINPSTASILLSFEAVFGLIFSVIFLKEEINMKMFFGCALMFTAAILSEYKPAGKKQSAKEPAIADSGTIL